MKPVMVCIAACAPEKRRGNKHLSVSAPADKAKVIYFMYYLIFLGEGINISPIYDYNTICNILLEYKMPY